MESTAENEEGGIQVKDGDPQVEEERGNGNGMRTEKELGKTEEIVQEENPTSKWVKILEEVSEKGCEVLKASASKVGDFTTHATHIAKLKLEAHKLNNELGKLILEMGHKLWELNKSQSLDKVEDEFLEDFKKVAVLEEELEENQNQMQN